VRNELKAGPAGAGDSDATVGPASQPARRNHRTRSGRPGDPGPTTLRGASVRRHAGLMSPEAREVNVGPGGRHLLLGVMTLAPGSPQSSRGLFSPPGAWSWASGASGTLHRALHTPRPRNAFATPEGVAATCRGTNKRSRARGRGCRSGGVLLAAVAVGVALLKGQRRHPPEGVSDVTPGGTAESSLHQCPLRPGQQTRQEGPARARRGQAPGTAAVSRKNSFSPAGGRGSRNVSLAFNSQPPGSL
jgi:hypothetical protein